MEDVLDVIMDQRRERNRQLREDDGSGRAAQGTAGDENTNGVDGFPAELMRR